MESVHCNYCGKDIEHPLELYDGSLFCPFCREPIIKELRYTEQNKALFNFSELCYLSALEELSNDRRKYEDNIERAVEYCYRAACLGNPEAVYRMGYYYDKDYIALKRSEAERCRIAYYYYELVCRTDRYTAGNTGGGEVDIPADEKLRCRAAVDLLNMLAFATDPVFRSGRYGYKRNKDEYLQKFPSIEDRLLTALSERSFAETDKLAVFKSLDSHERAPLFGMIRLSGDELKKIIDSRTTELLHAIKKHELVYIRPTGDGEYEWSALRNSSVNSSELTMLAEDSKRPYGFIYFFNQNGAHVLKRSALKMLSEVLRADDCHHIVRFLIEGGESSYTFFDDDIVYFLRNGNRGLITKNNLSEALSGLQDHVKGGI